MTFHLITIFPDIFDSYIHESILKRAQENKKVDFKIYNLRDFASDKHKTVDDTPYGGGPGMVLKVDAIFRCVEHIKNNIAKENKSDNESGIMNHELGKKISNSRIILTSAKGREYSQSKAEDLKEYTDVIIICGRYEGVDERVADHIADEEISIGKYVLTGGELAAMIIADSVSRLLPGVLGNEESLRSESFSISEAPNSKSQVPNKSKIKKSKYDFPVYTKPEEFNDWEVPKVLLGGNHKEIEKWRKNKQGIDG